MIVSLEVAELAKEKNYNVPCFSHYFLNGNWELKEKYNTYQGSQYKKLNYNNMGNYVNSYISAPNQFELQKWIREEHNLHIKIDDFIDDVEGIEWDYEIVKIGTDLDENGNYVPLIPYSLDDNSRKFKAYEEALMVGLLEGLKLIKL